MKASLSNIKDPKENSFKIPIEDFDINEDDEKVEEILNLLINNNFLTFDQYQSVSKVLKEAVKDKDVELLEILLSEEVETDGFSFKISKNSKTASLFKILGSDDEYVVPRSIVHDRESYAITRIIDSGCEDPKYLKKLEFAEDSELCAICRNSFYDSSIGCLCIPPKLKELRSGWCDNASCLTRIEVSPENPYFVMKDDSFLLGKSDPKSDNFDVLHFAVRDIKTAHITANIKVISPCAFQGCRGLTRVEIPENSELQTIGRLAFAFSNIKELFIPSNLSKLDEGWCAFADCLTRIEVSPENPYFVMKDDQFLLGKSDPKSDSFDVLHFAVRDIETAHIPANIKVISPFAFNNCENLAQVEIPENSELQIIGEASFQSSSIEEIYVPPRVTKICKNAFLMCKQLQIVEITEESDLQVIEDSAFEYSNLDQILIPKHVKKIGANAFSNCVQLVYVDFMPDSELQIIGSFAFACTSIDQLIIPSHATKICKGAFQNSRIQFIDIPENSELKVIGKYAFNGTYIGELFIPSQLKELRNGWCQNAHCLTRIEVSPENPYFMMKDDQFLLGKSDPKSDNFDVLHFAVRDIETAHIPANIKVISQCAFNECGKLTQVEIPENSELQIIGKYSFESSTLEQISIPSSVKKIDKFAFASCEFLRIFEIPENSELEKIGESAFGGIFEEIYIPQHVKVIPMNAFHSCQNLERVKFAKNSELSIIEEFAFCQTNLKEISIPPHVTQIKESAFCFCKNLEIVNIPENSELKTIEVAAFSGTKIEKIYVPHHLDDLIVKWCYGASNLKKIEISPLNTNFIFKDDAYLLGKTDAKSDNFDILLVAIPSICEAKISKNIK